MNSIRTASIATLGCKLNQAESFRIQSELAMAGVEILPFGEPVDLSIVNTCTVTHVADQQARQMLRRAARHSPGGYVVAMGCYAQVSPEEAARVEGVELVVRSDKEHLVAQLEADGFTLGNGLPQGPAAKTVTLSAAKGLPGDASPEPALSNAKGAQHDNSHLVAAPRDFAAWQTQDVPGPDHRVPLPATRVRQFVKVQDGCDDYCTYCIVPFARGHSLSRPADEIVEEVQRLVSQGCREVVLTGVQIGAYGRDRYRFRGQDLAAPGAPLAALVRRLLEATEVARIRISSIQPQDWPDDFLDLFANPRLCRHLHLPLQSGCDATLRRMSRRYSAAQFGQLVERLRTAIPDVALTADMIVGFPGEAEPEHKESLRFAREMGFAAMHVFRYSPRRGTAASRMAAQVPAEAKQRRSETMRKLADEASDAFRRRFIGETARVLWEEELAPSPEGQRRWSGLTGNYLRVVAEHPGDWLGQETDVQLFGPDGEGLLGMPKSL